MTGRVSKIKRWLRLEPQYRLSVLMVCMGNICRSPSAEGAMRARLKREGLDDLVKVDSAGTHRGHKGAPPDARAVAHAALRGIDIAELRAREVEAADFERFDLLLAMDSDNLSNLRHHCPEALQDRLGLLLAYAPPGDGLDVPDPYYGPPAGFEQVLDRIESSLDGLVVELRRRLALLPESSPP